MIGAACGGECGPGGAYLGHKGLDEGRQAGPVGLGLPQCALLLAQLLLHLAALPERLFGHNANANADAGSLRQRGPPGSRAEGSRGGGPLPVPRGWRCEEGGW